MQGRQSAAATALLALELLPPAPTEAQDVRRTAGAILVTEILWELRTLRRILVKVFGSK